MKTKIFAALFLLSSLLLTGCAKTDETSGTVPAGSAPADEAAGQKDPFEGMTEDEKIQEMIKAIEAKEDQMQADKADEAADEEAAE